LALTRSLTFLRIYGSGRDLLDFSDDDLKGPDLQLTAIQVKKLRREVQKLMAPPQHTRDDGSALDAHDMVRACMCWAI
jgi:hypothetical protein